MKKILLLLFITFTFISCGIGKPIMLRIVGAMSPSFPGFNLPFQFLSITNKGTGLSVFLITGFYYTK
mgnify:CR=1 FL=1